jgi:hypothetical protein
MHPHPLWSASGKIWGRTLSKTLPFCRYQPVKFHRGIPSALWVKGEFKLAVPVEVVTGLREFIVAIACPRAVSCNIRCMSRNLVGN